MLVLTGPFPSDSLVVKIIKILVSNCEISSKVPVPEIAIVQSLQYFIQILMECYHMLCCTPVGLTQMSNCEISLRQ